VNFWQYFLILCFRASWYKSNETPTWCNTVQVLVLQSHSTCFGRKRPSSVLNTPDDGRLGPKHVEWLCRNKTCTVLHQVGVSFDFWPYSRFYVTHTLHFITIYIIRHIHSVRHRLSHVSAATCFGTVVLSSGIYDVNPKEL